MYTELEHTADCSIRISAPDLPGLFLHAAHAFYDLCGVRKENGVHKDRELILDGPDLETLLVSWLEEILFVLEVDHEVLCPTRLSVQDTYLHVSAAVHLAGDVQREIKAVTHHQLKLTHDEDGWSVVVVFDV